MILSKITSLPIFKKILASPRGLVLLTIIIWSLGGLSLKLIAGSNMFSVMTIALLVASIANWLFYKKNFQGKPLPKITWFFPLASLTGYVIYWFFLLHSIEGYGELVSPPMVLNYTWPSFTAFFTVFLYKRQKASIPFFMSLAIGFIGIIVLGTKGDFNLVSFYSSLSGLMLGIMAGMAYGFFSAYSSGLESAQKRALFLLCGTSLSTVLLGIVSVVKYGTSAFDMSGLDWSVAIFDGIFLDFIGYTLWTLAQRVAADKKTDIAKVVSIANFLPLMSIFLVAIFFSTEREVITMPYFLVALGLIFLSSIIPGLAEKKEVPITSKTKKISEAR